MKKIVAFVSIMLFIIVVIFIIIYKPSKNLPWSKDKQKEYANQLIDKGLYLQAIAEYNKLIEYGNLTDSEKSNLSYIIGNIYMENLHDYENALASFLKVKIFYPKPKFEQELNMKMVECLERTGRAYEAQKEMDKFTSLKQEPAIPKGTIVAKIGNRNITMEELETKIKSLPTYMQSTYKEKPKKLEFLKNYVAIELLYDGARRRNYDKDPKINQQIDDIRKSLMVQKLIEEETKNKINVTDTEIKLYYEAHKKEFVEKKDKKEIQKSLDESKEQIYNILLKEKMEQAQQELLDKMFKAEKVVIYENYFTNEK